MKFKLLIIAAILLAGTAAADKEDNQPYNITVELKFDPGSSVYIDGTEYTSGYTASDSELTYPYIVSDQPAGIISRSGIERIKYTDSTTDTFSVTQTGNRFILPFTQGGYESVEDEEDEILNGNFLEGLEPSFSFFQPENPVVKVSYIFSHAIASYSGSEDGIDTITVRNKLNGKNYTELIVQAD